MEALIPHWPTLSSAVVVSLFLFSWLRRDMQAMEARLTDAIKENRQLILKYIAKNNSD